MTPYDVSTAIKQCESRTMLPTANGIVKPWNSPRITYEADVSCSFTIRSIVHFGFVAGYNRPP